MPLEVLPEMTLLAAGVAPPTVLLLEKIRTPTSLALVTPAGVRPRKLPLTAEPVPEVICTPAVPNPVIESPFTVTLDAAISIPTMSQLQASIWIRITALLPANGARLLAAATPWLYPLIT